MRTFRFFAALLFSTLSLYALSRTAAAADTPPNIVLLLSDDQAWTDYGFMGHEFIETPNLDGLAQRSAMFTRGYVPTSLCRPSLMTLATGLYTHQHKTSGNDPASIPGMPSKKTKGPAGPEAKAAVGKYADLREKLIAHIDEHPTVMKMLGGQGYLSHQSGKWWEGNHKRGGFTHGMTRGFPEPGGRHGDDGLKIGREGMQPVFDFIDMAAGEKKPFYLWYAPFMPHSPHTPPKRLFDKYKAKGIESDFVARYYAMCEWFDETCGQIIDHIDKKGLTGNTLFVFISDNGWIQNQAGNGFAPRSKQSPYEGGVRQPILFSWPGVIKPGDRGEQLCSSVDIVPTMLAAGGAEIPGSLPGHNLLEVLKSGAPTPREIVFGEGCAHDIANIDKPEDSLLYRWAVEGKWKLLLTYDGAVGNYARIHPRDEKRPQLFDLLADPHEKDNVAKDHPDVVAGLAKKIADWWPVTERKAITKWSE